VEVVVEEGGRRGGGERERSTRGLYIPSEQWQNEEHCVFSNVRAILRLNYMRGGYGG
jgi:hypothetical protein